VVALLVLVVPLVILVFLLAMEWLEATLLGSARAHGSGDALLARRSSAAGTSATEGGQPPAAVAAPRDGAIQEGATGPVLDAEPREAAATCRRQAFAG
jgi:hypothetical protein